MDAYAIASRARTSKEAGTAAPTREYYHRAEADEGAGAFMPTATDTWRSSPAARPPLARRRLAARQAVFRAAAITISAMI